MTTEYDPEYVEQLENAANEMAALLDDIACLKASGLSSDDLTNIQTGLTNYYKLKQDFSND